MTKLTPSELRKFLSYDPNTGELRWIQRGPEGFSSQSHHKRWTATFCGKVAGSIAGGYLRVGILGTYYMAHRLAWAIHYGEWPKHQVDHINGDRRDNRISNLRDVTVGENLRNSKKARTNKSGHTGVYRDGKKWRAYVNINKKQTMLGGFDSLEEAVAARAAAEKEHGYHANHGR